MSKYTRVCKWDIVFAYNIQLLLILDVYSIYKILRFGVQQQNNLYFCSILEDYSGNAICVKCQLAFFNYSKYCSSHARFNITHTHILVILKQVKFLVQYTCLLSSIYLYFHVSEIKPVCVRSIKPNKEWLTSFLCDLTYTYIICHFFHY